MADETKWFSGGFWERLQHPVFGAYSFSWALVNWDVIYRLAFGTEAYLFNIDEVWNTHFHQQFCKTFLYPLVPTIIFLFLGPVLREGYKALVDAIEMKMRRLSPVPGYKYETLMLEKDALQSAYSIVRHERDPQGKILMFQQRIEDMSKQLDRERERVVLLEADRIPGTSDMAIKSLEKEISSLRGDLSNEESKNKKLAEGMEKIKKENDLYGSFVNKLDKDVEALRIAVQPSATRAFTSSQQISRYTNRVNTFCEGYKLSKLKLSSEV